MLFKSSDSVCWDIEEIRFAKTIRFWEKKIFEIIYLLKIHVWHNWSVIMISGFETFSSHTNFNIILFKKTSYRYSWISFFRADSMDLCPIILFYSFLGIFEDGRSVRGLIYWILLAACVSHQDFRSHEIQGVLQRFW